MDQYIISNSITKDIKERVANMNARIKNKKALASLELIEDLFISRGKREQSSDEVKMTCLTLGFAAQEIKMALRK